MHPKWSHKDKRPLPQLDVARVIMYGSMGLVNGVKLHLWMHSFLTGTSLHTLTVIFFTEHHCRLWNIQINWDFVLGGYVSLINFQLITGQLIRQNIMPLPVGFSQARANRRMYTLLGCNTYQSGAQECKVFGSTLTGSMRKCYDSRKFML